MSINWNRTQSKTTIEHLTVRYHGEAETLNATPLRVRIEQLLDNVDLQPPGLSSGALLIIRKIQGLVPLPTTALVRSPQGERAHWIEQVHQQMATLYAMATRPGQQSVPANANAVLFSDAAEMLACLTRDILNGQAWQHWYWQRMLVTVPHFPAPALTMLWSMQAPFLPATLSILRSDEAYTAIALLSHEELQQVIHAVCANFDLPQPSFGISKVSLSESIFPSSAGLSSVHMSERLSGSPLAPDIAFGDFQAQNVKEQFIAPPWQRWLADVPQVNLSPEAQYLFGLGLTLYHAPSLAKSASFAQQTASWLQYYKHVARNATFIERNTSTSVSSIHTNTGVILSRNEHVETEHTTSSALLPASVSEMSTADVQSVTEESILATSHTSEEVKHEEVLYTTESVSTHERTTSSATHVTREFTVAEAKPLPAGGITTQLGGVLYLINLLPLLKSRIAEDIFAGYTSGWGVIEVLAKGLLGTLYARDTDDAMWEVLTTLDGREDPHKGQFITSKLHKQIIQEAYRLLIGLLNDPDLDMTQIAELVLCRYGRVMVSRTHVDLFMSMEEIALPVRRAGLDRDPGWMPDLARIVLFHFD